MGNRFGSDILIQADDPRKAAAFYVKELGFEITDETPNMISLHGRHINLFIERGASLGPVLEVTVESVEEAKARLLEKGCKIIKDEPDCPRGYVQDPFGLVFNLTSYIKARLIDSSWKRSGTVPSFPNRLTSIQEGK